MHAIATLGAGEALLGETSARLRRLGPGATVVLGNGTRLTVADVVSDDAVGAAELIVAGSEGPAVGVTTPRFLLVAYRGDRADDRAGDRGVATGEAGPVPGAGRDTIPPPRRPRCSHRRSSRSSSVSSRYAPGTDRFVTVDPSFEAAQVVTAQVPILGSVTCHRAVVPALADALGELEQRGLGSLVDPAGYQGCFVPSLIPGSGGISRHSWGIAIDVNFLPNPTGLPSYADPQLVEVMERWGFVAGARFLETDPGHFEYVGPSVEAAG